MKPAPPFPLASMNLLPWVHTCTRYTMNEHACEYAVARLPHVDETSLSLFLASINSPPSGHHTDVIHVHAKKDNIAVSYTAFGLIQQGSCTYCTHVQTDFQFRSQVI
jgi:hypothetical protein